MVRPRRPGTERRSALRRSQRARGSSRRATARPPVRPAGGLTTRAAVLGLVLCALVVTAALPLRELLSQRGQIAQAQQQQAAQRQRVATLEGQRRALDDPAYVAALARERLHFVLPGETAYVVLAPGQAEPSQRVPSSGAAPAGPAAPWWSQLWGSARAADRPVGAPAP